MAHRYPPITTTATKPDPSTIEIAVEHDAAQSYSRAVNPAADRKLRAIAGGGTWTLTHWVDRGTVQPGAPVRRGTRCLTAYTYRLTSPPREAAANAAPHPTHPPRGGTPAMTTVDKLSTARIAARVAAGEPVYIWVTDSPFHSRFPHGPGSLFAALVKDTAAQVTRVDKRPESKRTQPRYNVVTTAGTVEDLAAGQVFMLAPAPTQAAPAPTLEQKIDATPAGRWLTIHGRADAATQEAARAAADAVANRHTDGPAWYAAAVTHVVDAAHKAALVMQPQTGLADRLVDAVSDSTTGRWLMVIESDKRVSAAVKDAARAAADAVTDWAVDGPAWYTAACAYVLDAAHEAADAEEAAYAEARRRAANRMMPHVFVPKADIPMYCDPCHFHKDEAVHLVETDPAAPLVARRATTEEAQRHFARGGRVLVSERGNKQTTPVGPNTTTHDRTRTTWDELAAMVTMWRNRYPNQRYYVVPTLLAGAAPAAQVNATPEAAEEHAPDVTRRVTITERFDGDTAHWVARVDRVVVADVRCPRELGMFDSDRLRDALAHYYGTTRDAVTFDRAQRGVIVPAAATVAVPARVARRDETPTPAPKSSPWGRPQTVTRVAPGIVRVDCAGHGGYHMRADLNEQVPTVVRDASGWYEEDCEWAFVALTFPEHFDADTVAYAHDSAGHWYPEQYAQTFAAGYTPDRVLARWYTIRDDERVTPQMLGRAERAASAVDNSRISARHYAAATRAVIAEAEEAAYAERATRAAQAAPVPPRRVDASTAPVPLRTVDGGPHTFRPKEPGSVYCAAPCHYHESMAIHDVPTAATPEPPAPTWGDLVAAHANA